MLSITRKAIALCAALYGTVAISGYIMFGKNTQGDVLRNLTIRYVSTLVHPVLASVLIDFIVLATTFNLLVSPGRVGKGVDGSSLARGCTSDG